MWKKKHPHVRGEDPRRKRRDVSRVGNTPTCVGKTLPNLSPEALRQKHPHVRGEDRAAADEAERTRETPPRAWGRPERLKSFEGITQKHPHVRGEDPGVSPGPRFEAETPPRAWGRLSPFILFVCRPRNTPTCVGKTRTRRGPSCLTWKHPHVRGEDAFRLLSLR